MTDTTHSAGIEDIVAQTYSAIARPDSVIELLGTLGGAPRAPTRALDTHLTNAADIIDQMYPLSAEDLASLDTRPGSDFDCDLAIDSVFRVLHVDCALLDQTRFVVGELLPDWALDNVARGSSERDRIPRDDQPGLVRLHCREDDEDGSWFVVRRIAEDGGGDQIRFFALRMQWDDAHGVAFQDALGLSDVETMMLRHLVRGGTLRSFADGRKRSLGTVRNQMKVLQRKLAVRSKEEVLLLYAGFVGTLESNAGGAAQAQHVCSNVMPTRNGSLAWEELGDPFGKPVVFFHPLEGALLPNSAERAFRQQGLRILVPWRPFHGETTGSGFGLDGMEDFARDIAEWLAYLGIDQAPCFATQAGAPYMAAALNYAPQRFSRAFGFGAFLPIGNEAEMALIPISHRLSIRAVRASPAFARMYQRGMLASIGKGNLARFVENFYEGHDRELAAVRHPELLSVMRRSASYALANSIDGAIDTMQSWASDWSSLLVSREVPLTLFYGSEDANMGPSLVEAITRRLGLSKPQFLDDAGSFLLIDAPQKLAKILSGD